MPAGFTVVLPVWARPGVYAVKTETGEISADRDKPGSLEINGSELVMGAKRVVLTKSQAVIVKLLVDNFGKSYGAWMHDAAWGRDDRPVVTESEPVSMSRETTFDRDLHAVRDRAELGAIFTDLCERVAGDLQRKGYVGKTIGIKLRYETFKSVTRDQTLDAFTADARTIRQTAGLCLKRVDLTRRLRLLGVRVGSLAKASDNPEIEGKLAHPSAKRSSFATQSIAEMPQLF